VGFSRATAHDALELSRQVGADGGERFGCVTQDGGAYVRRGRSTERPPSDRQLVEDDSQREQVAARVHGLAADLLRRHVGHRAYDESRAGERGGQGRGLRRVQAQVHHRELGEPKSSTLTRPSRVSITFAGLRIAVHHALLVRSGQCVGERDADIEHACERQASRCHSRVEALALDQLHGEEADVALVLDRVEHHDVGMAERSDRARLALEAGEAAGVRGDVGRQHLERDLAPESQVLRADIPRPYRPSRGARRSRTCRGVCRGSMASPECTQRLPKRPAAASGSRSQQ
jgi:hypothetical protein